MMYTSFSTQYLIQNVFSQHGLFCVWLLAAFYRVIVAAFFFINSLYFLHETSNSRKLYIVGSWQRDSAVGIATGYGLDDRGVGVRVPLGSRIFSSPRLPDRLWDPPNLLSNGYRGFFPRR
jgi:hypothetical protein